MKIMGYNYTVDTDKDQNKIGCFGRLIMSDQEIQIANDLHPEQAASTMLHECIEALNYHLNIALTENQIHSLEAGLFQILIDAGVDLTPLLRCALEKPVTDSSDNPKL